MQVVNSSSDTLWLVAYQIAVIAVGFFYCLNSKQSEKFVKILNFVVHPPINWYPMVGVISQPFLLFSHIHDVFFKLKWHRRGADCQCSVLCRGRSDGHAHDGRSVIDTTLTMIAKRHHDYFYDNCIYLLTYFRWRYRMRWSLFLSIMHKLIETSPYFTDRHDAIGRSDLTPLNKCTAALWQLVSLHETWFIHRSKLMNVPSKPMSIVYIHRLTDESTNERNSDEIKLNYSSVPTNVMIYSSVTWNRQIYPITFIGDTSPMNVLRRGAEVWI
jgi:hypothetical protein